MATDQASQDELLLNALVDGELSPQEHAAAAARLASDREFARAYAVLMRLKASVVEGVADNEPVSLELPRRNRRVALAAGLAAAVLVCGMVLTGAIHWPSSPSAYEPEVEAQMVKLVSLSQPAVLPDLAPAGLKLVSTVMGPGARGELLTATYLGPRGCRLELRVQHAEGAVITADGTDRRHWQVGDLVYQLIAHGMPAKRFATVAEVAERATRSGGLPIRPGRQLREAQISAPPCLA